MEKPDIGDYYHDLDLAETATVAQITRAFRSLALIWHPDKNIGNEEQVKPEFVKINLAHETLVDTDARAAYDWDYSSLKQQWTVYREWERRQETERRNKEEADRKEAARLAKQRADEEHEHQEAARLAKERAEQDAEDFTTEQDAAAKEAEIWARINEEDAIRHLEKRLELRRSTADEKHIRRTTTGEERLTSARQDEEAELEDLRLAMEERLAELSDEIEQNLLADRHIDEQSFRSLEKLIANAKAAALERRRQATQAEEDRRLMERARAREMAREAALQEHLRREEAKRHQGARERLRMKMEEAERACQEKQRREEKAREERLRREEKNRQEYQRREEQFRQAQKKKDAAAQAAKQRAQDEADVRSHEAAEARRHEEQESAVFRQQVLEEQQRLARTTSSKMTPDQRDNWIKQEAAASIHPFAEQSRQVHGMPNLSKKKFKDWLARSEKLVGFLERLVIEPRLQGGQAQLLVVLNTVIGKVDGKKDAHFPEALRTRARTLLHKWEVIGWGARRY